MSSSRLSWTRLIISLMPFLRARVTMKRSLISCGRSVYKNQERVNTLSFFIYKSRGLGQRSRGQGIERNLARPDRHVFLYFSHFQPLLYFSISLIFSYFQLFLSFLAISLFLYFSISLTFLQLFLQFLLIPRKPLLYLLPSKVFYLLHRNLLLNNILPDAITLSPFSLVILHKRFACERD